MWAGLRLISLTHPPLARWRALASSARFGKVCDLFYSFKKKHHQTSARCCIVTYQAARERRARSLRRKRPRRVAAVAAVLRRLLLLVLVRPPLFRGPPPSSSPTPPSASSWSSSSSSSSSSPHIIVAALTVRGRAVGTRREVSRSGAQRTRARSSARGLPSRSRGGLGYQSRVRLKRADEGDDFKRNIWHVHCYYCARPPPRPRNHCHHCQRPGRRERASERTPRQR